MIWVGDSLGVRLTINKQRVVYEAYDHNIDTENNVPEINARRKRLYYILSIVAAVILIAIRLNNIRTSNLMYGAGEYYLQSFRRHGIEDTSGNFLMKLFEIINSMFSYYYFCDYCLHKKAARKNLVPISLYLVTCILSSARSTILHFIFACTLIWLLTNRYNNYQIRLSLKTKRRLILILIIGLLTFAILGYLTGKTQNAGFLDSIEVYSAGAIPALDGFISEFDGNPSFGMYTLQGFRRILELIGIKVSYNVSYYSHGDYVVFGNGIVTNIYTCLRNYLVDYGFIGSQVAVFFIGVFFGVFYRITITETKISPYRYTMYSIFVFYVFFSFITERVFSQIPTATTIIGIFFVRYLFRTLPVSGD